MFKKLKARIIKSKENKKVKIYALVMRNKPKDFITFCIDEDQCREYLMYLLTWQRFEHYKNWCDICEIDYMKKSSREYYYSTVISDDDKNGYAILPLTFLQKDILAIIRMFSNCVPLGASFELPEELIKFKTAVEIENKLEKVFDVKNNTIDLNKLHEEEETNSDEDVDKAPYDA